MKLKIFLIFLLCFFTSGCWNYNELNELAIVTGIGIDKHENGYKVSLMISNSRSTQSSSREGEAQTTVFTGTGKTFTEALSNIDVKTPRNLYLGHLEVVLVDEEIAKDNINIVLENLMRNPETAKKYYIAIARDNKSEEILKGLSPLESFPSQNISLNIQNSSQSEGISTEMVLSEFIKTILKQGVNSIAPSISIQGEENKIDNQESLKETEPKAMLKARSIGLFKDFKLVTWTTEKESQGINIINNKTERLYVTTELDKNKKVVVLLDSTKCKSDININDLNINLNINVKGAIVETDTDLDLENPKTIEKINKSTEKEIKNLVFDGINLAQKYKTDIFGFGNMIYRKDFKYWYKVKKEWDDNYFPKINFKVKVNANIESKGALENTIKEKKNES